MTLPARRAALAAAGLLLLAAAAGCLAAQEPGAADDSAAGAPSSAAAAAAARPHLHGTAAEQAASLQRFFDSLDVNRDGDISTVEAASYAAAALDMGSEGWSAGEAAQTAGGALDGADAGTGISAAELRQHLRALMQDHRVEEWVTHGLNLPQYASAFKANAITALDFPFLAADGGAALEADLGVASKLHQQQILRGLKRLMLGLGRLPSAPLQLSCTAANQSAVRLSWQPPAAPGHPPLHKYLLQRQRLLPHAEAGGAGGGAPYGGSCAVEERWEAAGEPDDEESSWLDAPSAAGSYRYRLAAWSAYGHSPYAVSANACTVRVAAQWQHGGGGAAAAALAPAEMQALVAAAAAAAGGNLLVPLALPAGAPAAAPAGSGATWSWSAASSTVVVGLSILLKASQLRLGAVVGAAWRSLLSWLAGRRGGGDGAGAAGAAAAQAPAAEGQLNRQSEEQQQGTGMAALGVAADGAAFPTAAAGMRRTGTSHASLHSLGSEGGEQLPAGMRVTCTAAWSSMQLEGSELDAFAAAEAAADQVAADEELQTAVLRGARCAYAGCHRRFDRLRDMRRRLESHYCGLCQRMYCLHHTRVSPHGPRGGCGLESKCVCYACFAELAPTQQAAYERVNRLPKPAAAAAAAEAADVYSSFPYVTPSDILPFLRAEARPGDVDSVLAAIDAFATFYPMYRCGPEKGAILESLVAEQRPALALELGTFMGYGAARIARNLPPGGRLISIEASEEQAEVARQVLALAGLPVGTGPDARIQVVNGLSGEVLPTLRQLAGVQPGAAAGFVFLDHCKPCYLPDLLSLERLGLVAPGSLVLADNVLIPGAPDYLAHVMMPAGGGGAGEATEGGARGTGTSSSGASGDPGALAYQTDLRYTAFEVEERYKKDWQPKRDAMSVSRCVAAA
ncbi:catechol O-methyltransferase-like [Micractinium conductrix]|uniref:catechol O-methyltransferase n=1 Tax=Micractinium conductrix TaxID=554055 RepID=A0A2P6VE74_9CHLO|nr:catechol O-methyltransferase-like [Micractinium conductrix]|eukprot:PSC72400.1 catechol O-methyltransferase-like [Micractinium conductrix]